MIRMKARMVRHVELDERLLAHDLGEAAVEQIRTRTRHGVDMHGRAFARYSDAYRDELTKHGDSPRPDGTRSGGMLDSLRASAVRVTQDKASLSIDVGSAYELRAGALHHGKRGQPARPFMGLTDAEVAEIGRMLGRVRGVLLTRPGAS